MHWSRRSIPTEGVRRRRLDPIRCGDPLPTRADPGTLRDWGCAVMVQVRERPLPTARMRVERRRPRNRAPFRQSACVGAAVSAGNGREHTRGPSGPSDRHPRPRPSGWVRRGGEETGLRRRNTTHPSIELFAHGEIHQIPRQPRVARVSQVGSPTGSWAVRRPPGGQRIAKSGAMR